jgi:Asp-tRNA(Asn)/Glu-tRNA(Gln) amidotransferase A subunit family amidase
VAQARASDTRRAEHRLLGPMDGIPVLLKDDIGHGRTTAGSLALVNARPADAFITGRLRAGGAVILGKANLSEWANFRSTQSASGWSGRTRAAEHADLHRAGAGPTAARRHPLTAPATASVQEAARMLFCAACAA